MEMDYTDKTGESQYRGSGTLVNLDDSNSVVLTAAHNLWNRTNKIGARKVTFYPGFSPKNKIPFESTCFAHSRSYQKATDEDEACNHDFGIVVLQNVSYPHSLELLNMGHKELLKYPVNVTGYPGEWDEMYTMQGSVQAIHHAYRMFYDIDTTRGNSGSGVWLKRRDKKSHFCVGVHTYGFSPQDKYPHNSGTRITDEVLKKIDTWTKTLLNKKTLTPRQSS